MTVGAEHGGADAPPRDVTELRVPFGDTDGSADGGGAPKGCVKSLQAARTASASAISTSTRSRRRASCKPTRRSIATCDRRRAVGTPLRPRIPPRLGATRPRRRRARSRPRQPRARLRAAWSSGGAGVGAASSTICVRHHNPSASRSGSCATRPAACRSSSQRCTLRRWARTNRARSSAIARDRAPAHHRCQPRDQLSDRGREARRALRVTEPEQVALDRVRARLQPVVTGRRASALAARAAEQRAHHHAARLGRQRLARRAIPATRRPSSTSVRRCDPAAPPTPEGAAAAGSTAPASGRSRHSWRGPEPPAAAGAPGARRRRPSSRGWRSVRRAATVRDGCICGRSPESGGAEWPEGRRRRPGWLPGLLRSAAGSLAGRDTRPLRPGRAESGRHYARVRSGRRGYTLASDGPRVEHSGRPLELVSREVGEASAGDPLSP